MTRKTEIIVIFIFSLSFISVSAIKCYQCNSVQNPECEDVNATETLSITKTFLKNCTGDYDGEEPFCRKIIQTILDEVKTTRITRTCGWIRPNNTREDKCLSGDTDFILEENCECFTDACNSTTKQHHFTFLVQISFILCILIFAK